LTIVAGNSLRSFGENLVAIFLIYRLCKTPFAVKKYDAHNINTSKEDTNGEANWGDLRLVDSKSHVATGAPFFYLS